MYLIVSYLSTFSDYCKTAFENYKNVCFFYTDANSSFV